MPSHDVDQTSARMVAPCRNCHQSERVTPIALEDVSSGVRYWRCDGCRFVWATRDGEDLNSTAADRTPRKST
jgi:hypothetical protein